MRQFRFTESDIRYLREELGYGEDFLSYLHSLQFTGTLRSMQEGELVFGNEPMLRVEAPLAEAQLIETAMLNIVNYQTLIATKAARIKQTVGSEDLMEFGTRRAQEFDAALWGTRAAFIGGFFLQQAMSERAKKVWYPCLGNTCACIRTGLSR
ncbi:hypothetical protein GCM10020331_086300 [Ectobacillus funiculus]